MGKNKPSGMRAGRKLRVHRRNQRWAQKKYNKSHSISAMKANPFGGASMAKGIVLEKMWVLRRKTTKTSLPSAYSFWHKPPCG